MSYRHIYSPEALAEYKQAVAWYLERSEGAAAGFVAAVSGKIREICKDPFRYRNSYKIFRETSLKKFPFSIVYFADKENKAIIITSVFHHRRNPRKKYKK
jgi:plasmid stabilization system protein ParE